MRRRRGREVLGKRAGARMCMGTHSPTPRGAYRWRVCVGLGASPWRKARAKGEWPGLYARAKHARRRLITGRVHVACRTMLLWVRVRGFLVSVFGDVRVRDFLGGNRDTPMLIYVKVVVGSDGKEVFFSDPCKI